MNTIQRIGRIARIGTLGGKNEDLLPNSCEREIMPRGGKFENSHAIHSVGQAGPRSSPFFLWGGAGEDRRADTETR